MDQPDQDQRDLLQSVRDEWLAAGASTGPVTRADAEAGVWKAFRAVDHAPSALMFIWVQSPMAGVLASTYVGPALGKPLRERIMKPLDDVLSTGAAAATDVRAEVDATVWDVACAAVHRRVETELTARDPEWDERRRNVGNDAWNQVWERVGDQVYSQGWEQQAGESESLFEANLGHWPEAMMEGQFGAGSMARLDALDLLGEVDRARFAGLRQLARSCGWWWGFEAGAVLSERPTRLEIAGERVTIEFRDGWTVAD